jgi:hypothetical protein
MHFACKNVHYTKLLQKCDSHFVVYKCGSGDNSNTKSQLNSMHIFATTEWRDKNVTRWKINGENFPSICIALRKKREKWKNTQKQENIKIFYIHNINDEKFKLNSKWGGSVLKECKFKLNNNIGELFFFIIIIP